jgi:hypothetical protein
LSDALLLFSKVFLCLSLNFGGNSYFVGFLDAFCDGFLVLSFNFGKFLFSLFSFKNGLIHLGLGLLGIHIRTE